MFRGAGTGAGAIWQALEAFVLHGAVFCSSGSWRLIVLVLCQQCSTTSHTTHTRVYGNPAASNKQPAICNQKAAASKQPAASRQLQAGSCQQAASSSQQPACQHGHCANSYTVGPTTWFSSNLRFGGQDLAKGMLLNWQHPADGCGSIAG